MGIRRVAGAITADDTPDYSFSITASVPANQGGITVGFNREQELRAQSAVASTMLLQPSPHQPLVVEVFLTKPGLQVSLFWCHDRA